MKKILMMAVAAALLCGCEKAVIQDDDAAEMTKRVTFDIASNGWEVSTRSLDSEGQEMTDLWIFDYVGGELTATVHKSQGDAGMSEPVVQLKYGVHRLYFVASRGKQPTVSGSTIVWSVPSDTFWKAIDLTVGDGLPSVVQVALDRVATRLRVHVSDLVPEGTASLSILPDEWWYGVDYTTGMAVDRRLQERTVTVPAAYVGTTGDLVASIYGLSDDGEWTTGMEIKAYDGNGDVIGSVTLSNVPFMRNRTTDASGDLFSSSTTFGITLNDVWNADYYIEW